LNQTCEQKRAQRYGIDDVKPQGGVGPDPAAVIRAQMYTPSGRLRVRLEPLDYSDPTAYNAACIERDA
jgi:hypothetical protein